MSTPVEAVTSPETGSMVNPLPSGRVTDRSKRQALAPDLEPVPNRRWGGDHELESVSQPGSQPGSQPALWSYGELAGRLTELISWGGTASLTFTADLIRQAQMLGEPAAWITPRPSVFFPPDLACCGIDLHALPLIRVRDASTAARSAARLLRSGAFGLLLIDLGAKAEVPMPLQSRLLGLAQKHGAAVVFLTEKPQEAPSLSALVSLRAQSARARIAPDRFACTIRALKDKRRAPGWSHSETYRGPAGLC